MASLAGRSEAHVLLGRGVELLRGHEHDGLGGQAFADIGSERQRSGAFVVGQVADHVHVGFAKRKVDQLKLTSQALDRMFDGLTSGARASLAIPRVPVLVYETLQRYLGTASPPHLMFDIRILPDWLGGDKGQLRRREEGMCSMGRSVIE